ARAAPGARDGAVEPGAGLRSGQRRGRRRPGAPGRPPAAAARVDGTGAAGRRGCRLVGHGAAGAIAAADRGRRARTCPAVAGGAATGAGRAQTRADADSRFRRGPSPAPPRRRAPGARPRRRARGGRLHAGGPDLHAGTDTAKRRRLSGRPAPVRIRPDPHHHRHPLEHRPRARAPQLQRLLFRRAGRDRPRPPAAARRHHRAPPQVAAGPRGGDDRAAGPGRARAGARPEPQGGRRRFAAGRGDRRPLLHRRRGQQGGRGLRRRRRLVRHRQNPRPRRAEAEPRREAPPGRELMRSLALAVIASLLCLLVGPVGAAPARLSSREAFERGRTAFGRAEYRRAIEILNPLVYPEVLLDSEGEVVQAHRMLGVAYLYTNRPEEAKREFHKLLELRPDYRFDPLLDPQPVVDAFNAVVQEEEAEIAAIELRRRQRDAELAARRQREARLRATPAPPLVYERHSYLLNFVPFGAGQFQNGQRRRGWLFLGLEGGLAAISVGA